MNPTVALLAEGVDRNPMCLTIKATDAMSPSSRRAWIEIARGRRPQLHEHVALLAEGVDRNIRPMLCCDMSWSMEAKVALLAEGVDRNNVLHQNSILFAGRPPRGGRG